MMVRCFFQMSTVCVCHLNIGESLGDLAMWENRIMAGRQLAKVPNLVLYVNLSMLLAAYS
jgi:hypothetical protein